MKYKILCIGNQWRGSDDGSIFRAFSRAGHFINIIDDKFFVPADSNSFMSKVFRRLGSSFFRRDYNQTIIRQFDSFLPDIVCVYKGASFEKDTLLKMKKAGVPVFCIYPDVSHFDHGPRIPDCIPHYDYIFHTKTFGIEELKNKFRYTKAKLIQHCADPDIHRKMEVDSQMHTQLYSEASFIGSYSPKKERILADFSARMPECQLKIWGGAWDKSAVQSIVNAWEKQTIFGDVYAAAINSCTINIAILSESSKTTLKGDQVTSRTFHIPGCGGFMLHERTAEFLDLFDEDKEAVCFDGPQEMADKVKYYLSHDQERERIALAGYEKVRRYHTSDHRVKEILSGLVSEGLL